MNEVLVYVALVLLGVCFGSFAAATVWRLRARQLQGDKDAKEPYDHAEYSHLKKLLGKKTTDDRSQCLHCGYKLRFFDLIPVLSWVGLRGKCRNCKQFIGWFELVMELGVAAYFVLSYIFWPFALQAPLEYTHFGLWLVAGVIMAVLFAYDYKWLLLPDRYSFALAVVGVGIATTIALSTADPVGTIIQASGAVAVIAGLYGVLYAVSKGRWVGFGDVKLGIGLGLLLVDWQLALLTVFLANLLGCLAIIPALATKKIQRTTAVPFGPFLILGAVLAGLFGKHIIDWYLGFLL